MEDCKKELDEQEQLLRKRCESQGWQIIGISRVVCSGNNLSLDLKKRVLPAAQNNNFSYLLAVNMSRICRNPKILLDFSRELQNYSVDILDINCNKIDAAFDKDLHLAKLLSQSLINEYEPKIKNDIKM